MKQRKLLSNMISIALLHYYHKNKLIYKSINITKLFTYLIGRRGQTCVAYKIVDFPLSVGSGSSSCLKPNRSIHQ